MKKWPKKFSLVLLLTFILLASCVQIHSDKLTVTIPPGRWHWTRIRNLPQNAVIMVSVKTDRPLAVSFVDQSHYRKYPRAQYSLFEGLVQKTRQFRVRIPAPGDYYLVLDNRLGTREAQVQLVIRESRDPKAPDPKTRPADFKQFPVLGFQFSDKKI